MTLPQTASQTVGPYYTIGLCRRPENELADRNDTGAVQLIGQLLDGQGAPISDGMIEIWDAAGERWGRSGTDSDGRFSFVVTKPERARGPGAAARRVRVRARAAAAPADADLLPGRGGRERGRPGALGAGRGDRATLVAEQEDGALRFDIRMQGDRETVFFEH